jgi:hypothetical protein
VSRPGNEAGPSGDDSPNTLFIHRESTEQFFIEEFLKLLQRLTLRTVRDAGEKKWPLWLPPGGLFIALALALDEQQSVSEIALLLTEEEIKFNGVRANFKPGTSGEAGAGV